MKPNKVIHSLLRIGLVGALLLPSSGGLTAQAFTAPPEAQESLPDAVEDEEPDPNAGSTDDVLEADLSGTLAAGPALPDAPNQFDPVADPETGEESLVGGPEIGEDGELPSAGEYRLFIPAVMSAEQPEVAREAESSTEGSNFQAAAAESSTAAASSPSVMGDFDGDGFDDLAVGVPFEDVIAAAVNHKDAGSVHVIYGAAGGLTPVGNQLWTQNTGGVADIVEDFDHFGFAVAAGDFNGDGFDDLAISAHGEDLGAVANAGAVHILYGSAAGLTADGSQFWAQDVAGVPDSAETGDYFGLALAAGKFSDDKYDDLAIGVPLEDIGGVIDGGLVQVLYGTADGLAVEGSQVWHQSVRGVLEVVEANDMFGATLAAGDFDDDGNSVQDLAVGTPAEDVANVAGAGAVQIIRGASSGLVAANNQLFTQATAGMVDDAQTSDSFGYALAAGNFDGEKGVDLAVGVPNEDAVDVALCGAVHLIYSAGGSGLAVSGNQLLTQGAANSADDGAEPGDAFGQSLAAGRFDANAADDLAVGAPSEDVAGKIQNVTFADAGAVTIFYGTPGSPLSSGGSQFWSQESPGVLEAGENGDNFGWALSVGRFDSGNVADLVIGVPNEMLGGVEAAGGVNLIYGPLGSNKQQFWSQDSAGVLGVGEMSDYFGYIN